MMLWECPHPREFLDSIFEILQKGDRHLVIHLPFWRMDEFREAIFKANKRYGYPLDFPLAIPGASPYDYLVQCAKDPENFDRENLTRQAMNKENIFLIMPPQSSASQQEEWLDFMEKISLDARNYQERQANSRDCADFAPKLPWRLLILVPSHFASPRPETSLEIFLGGGLTRQSDLEYAIESCNEESNVSRASSRLWLDSICQGLGIRDVGLCSHIFRELPLDEEEVLKMLRTYPFMDMDKDLIASVIAMDDGSCLWVDFRQERQRLLDYGILEADCRNVESLHPAALARANRPHAIHRLLLQGQIRTYLPLVQEVQTFIHKQLGQLCGDDWHKKDPDRYPGIDMDIGPLASYMSAYLKADCGEDLLELAYCWRDVRHHLAHGRLIKLDKAREAVERYEKMRRLESQFL